MLLLGSRSFALALFLIACTPSNAHPSPTPLTTTPTQMPMATALPVETFAPRITAPTMPPLPRPAATRTPTDTPIARPRVTVREETVTFSAYPYAAFLRNALDRAYNIPYQKLDVPAYNAAANAPTETKCKAIILENEYLRLTFVPDLGGRLYQVLYKPTHQTLFYNNRVLKPTPWGPPQQGGWLAAGGMEWALPVNEHGYEWGAPWSYTVDGATIVLVDSRDDNRVRARITVTLPADAAYWTVRPRIENLMNQPARVQFWINAQMALGARNVSPATEFFVPTPRVFIHSTGNAFVPAQGVPRAMAQSPSDPIGWPHIGGRDLSRYQNWSDYLGVFAAALQADYVGAYNHTTELGIARVFPRARAPGVKLFAFGPDFGGRKLFADDGSDYFELWGGLNRTFFKDDDVRLEAGEAREWEETWIPFHATSISETIHGFLLR